MKIENRVQESYQSDKEQETRIALFEHFKECPIPGESLLPNIGLFINSKNLARILMIDFLYKQIINTHGVIMEFGTRWGQNIALFSTLRGIYEPFNRHRKVIGFDTFSGFPLISKEDNADAHFAYVGGLTTTPKYDEYLEKIMYLQEQDAPLSHIKKYEIVKGDASKTLPEYLNNFPETLISLAYFDFDMFQPTIDCLNTIWPKCMIGTVIAFDELCDDKSPGETIAFLKFFSDKGKIRLQRSPFVSRISYFIVE